MNGTKTTASWLGTGDGFNEHFPTCDLTEAQVSTLVGFTGARVAGLGPSPAIHKLTTNGIVEVTVRWAKNMKDFGAGGKLWMDCNGTYIAAAMWEGPRSDATGPMRVYRWLPMEGGKWERMGKVAEEAVYTDSDSSKGSTKATRNFIKKHWMGT